MKRADIIIFDDIIHNGLKENWELQPHQKKMLKHISNGDKVSMVHYPRHSGDSLQRWFDKKIKKL